MPLLPSNHCAHCTSIAMTEPTGHADNEKLQPYSTVPHNNKTYSQHAYWEERFEHESEYEWLAGFDDIRSTLLPLLHPTDRILVVGCGNSNLSSQLYHAGYQHTTNIDFSDTVIRKQAAKHSDQPDMQWLTMDMLHMTFPPASFTVVLDKCTMDALTTTEGSPWQPNHSTRTAVHTLLSSISTLLTVSGRYIQVSFTQPPLPSQVPQAARLRLEGEDDEDRRWGGGCVCVRLCEGRKGGRVGGRAVE